VSDPRDEIDAWLDHDVQPLQPPPGAFERISTRARRRKRGRAIMGAAGVLAVIAGVAVAPQIASALRPGGGPGGGHPAASGTLAPRPTRGATRGPGGTASHSATEILPGSSLSATTSGEPVPSGFLPTSITMIGDIGAVIGQAGTPGHCATQYCTSLAGTSDYGSSWYGVSAPLTGAPRGDTGVSQLRFLNLSDGWAFGPQLWVTSNGGASWHNEQTYGLRVTDLETAGTRAFAVLASCTGTGSDYAADCTSFSLFSSLAGSRTWLPVPGPVSDLTATGGRTGPAAAASLVIASGTAADPGAPTGYLLAPSGTLLSGPLTGAAWKVAGQVPAACRPGAAQLSGEPAGAQLASGSASAAAAGSQLLLSCDGAASAGRGSQAKTIWASADGAHWHQVGAAPGSGTATSLAAADGGLVVLATTTGIDYSADSGKTWQSAAFSAGAPRGGFSYVGMTTASQGVAVPADASLGEVFSTSDGGQSWTASPVSGGG
jgi:hypothetical protein